MTGKKRWILLEESVDIDGRVNVTGDANLILPDGVTLTVSGGIYVPHGSSLTVWAQSRDPETMGQLVVEADDGPGIGGFNGAGGSITINGGKVTAKGGANAAGIGGADSYPVENISINRGIVSATGGSGAAGIGSAKGTMWSIMLNGDDVFAEGGSSAAGIGAGTGGHVASVSIGGGKVEAIGHGGAGIGFGSRRGSINSIDIKSLRAAGRTFYVLSAHDGVAKEVAQGTGKTLEWSCGEFSTFLLAYSDNSASPVQVITIGFDANGGSGSMNPLFAQAGESVVLEANKFTCDGYSFDGWNTDKDGKGTAYADKATVEAEEDMTLYAQWKVPSSTTAETGTASSKSSSSSSSTPKTNDAMPITALFMLLCVSAIALGASRTRLNRKGSRR